MGIFIPDLSLPENGCINILIFPNGNVDTLVFDKEHQAFSLETIAHAEEDER